MKIGYIRVSTTEQNTARQEVLMAQLGVDKIFIEKTSAKDKNRPMLKEMMNFAREGDEVIVESISRFARNTMDCISLVQELDKKKIKFVSKKESLDTTNPFGVFILTVFAAFAQLERETILLRQQEGIDIAKAKGVFKGKKPIAINNFDNIYKNWSDGYVTAVHASEKIGISLRTYYRRASETELKSLDRSLFENMYNDVKKGLISVKEASRKLGILANTFYQAIIEEEIKTLTQEKFLMIFDEWDQGNITLEAASKKLSISIHTFKWKVNAHKDNECKRIDKNKFLSLYEEWDNGNITLEDASKKLGVSIHTFKSKVNSRKAKIKKEKEKSEKRKDE